MKVKMIKPKKRCNVCGREANTEYEKPFLCEDCAVEKYEGRD